MSTLLNDIKYGLRMLVKSPGFTVVAVLTLAIGISANITTFSVVNTVLLRPLPFDEPDRLVIVQQHIKTFNMLTGFSYPYFQDFRQQNQVFEDLIASTQISFDVSENQGTSKVDGAIVSSNFFSMLGVSACLGRTFTEADEKQNSEPVVVISHDFCSGRFGPTKEALGQTITLQDKVYTIVGVLPASFNYLGGIGEAQIWTVLNPSVDGGKYMDRQLYCLSAVGRLKSGMTIEKALPLLNEMYGRLFQDSRRVSDIELQMYGLRDMAVGDVRATLWILYSIVGFILLIVCANVANLCLARASARDKEVAIRGALGANRLRLLRQFTTESVLLSLAGGIIGLFITVWMINVFRVKIADFVPMAGSIRIDLSVLLFGLCISLLVGFFLGIIPFWFMQRCRLTNVLTERRSSLAHHTKLSNMLISGQIAMALILSIGMGLMIHSMIRLSSAETGFNQDNLVTFKIDMGRRNDPQRQQFSRDFLERLSALPYVSGVSTDSSMLCSQRANIGPMYVEGYTSPDGRPPMVISHNVSPDYFRTLQMPIRQGRAILPEEHQKKDKVTVINESLAQRFWPEKDPIGRELTFCGQQFRVIGIVADVIQGNIKGDKPYQAFFPFDVTFHGPDLGFVVRTECDPGQIMGQARAILRDMDATIPIYDIGTFKAQINNCVRRERFTTAFLTVFASIALLLIAIGIYGVISYAVAQRTREIGIRMALGAEKINILTMVLKQGLVLLIVGLVVGITGALGLTRFLSSYLFEISTTDPLTFVSVPILITAVSMLACYLPARRAAKVNPVEALRYE